MPRLMLLIVACLISGCALSGGAAAKSPQSVIDASPIGAADLMHNRLATVRVDREDGGHGTGFFVSSHGHVVTAYHVVHKASALSVLIKRQNGPTFSRPAKLIAFDEPNDIALLQAEHAPKHVVVLAMENEALTGDELYVSGYPHAYGELVTRGWLMSRSYDPGHETAMHGMLVVQLHGGSGNSGSGVFLAKNGHLIGIWQLMLSSGRPRLGYVMVIHLARPIGPIRALLAANHVPLNDNKAP